MPASFRLSIADHSAVLHEFHDGLPRVSDKTPDAHEARWLFAIAPVGHESLGNTENLSGLFLCEERILFEHIHILVLMMCLPVPALHSDGNGTLIEKAEVL